MAGMKPINRLAAGHACVDVYQGSVTALVPLLVAERGWSYASVSGVVLAATVLSALAQPLFGLLTDRWAMPWLLAVSTLAGGAGIAASGVAGSYALTLGCVALSGLGVAAYHPEAARQARIAAAGSHSAMGWFVLGGNLGFAAAPLLVAGIAVLGGLRWSPLLLLPALAGALLCLRVRRVADTAGTLSRTAPVANDRGSFVTLSAAVICRSVVFVGLGTFVALYAQERSGGGPAAGTVALFVLYLGGAVGTVLGGRLAGRWGRVPVCRWSYLTVAGAVAGVVYLPAPTLPLFVALASAGLYVPFSLQVTLGQDYLPTRVGTASGITLGLTVSAGGLAGPVLGRLADVTSLQTALTPLILLPVLGWLLFRRLAEPGNNANSTGGVMR